MQINSENYVECVLRTDTPITPELIARISEPETIRLIHAVLGMLTETGELGDMLKRHLFYDKPLDFVNGAEELGDVQWYVGLAIDVMRTTMNEILTGNNAKLRLRFPEKFSEHHATNRNVTFERVLLEDHYGYEDVSDQEYCAMNNIPYFDGKCSARGEDWLEFSNKVFKHIENYTVPQYGDKGDDQVSVYDSNDCIKQVQKYASRFGKNAREGQQKLDIVKMAHYSQLAYDKYREEHNASN